MGLTVSGVLLLVFDVALGTTAGLVAFGVTLAVLVALWAGPPLATRRRRRPADAARPG